MFWRQLNRIEKKIDELLVMGRNEQRREIQMAGELDELEANVAALDAALDAGIDSAIGLMNGLAAKLDEAIASGDMSRVAAVNTDLKARTQSLAEKVMADSR